MWNGDIWTTRCIKKEDDNIHVEGWNDFKEAYSLRKGDILLFSCESHHHTLNLFDGEKGGDIFLNRKELEIFNPFEALETSNLFDGDKGGEIFLNRKELETFNPFEALETSDAFYTYFSVISDDMKPYVDNIIVVAKDGNCGFRCIASLL